MFLIFKYVKGGGLVDFISKNPTILQDQDILDVQIWNLTVVNLKSVWHEKV